MCEARYWTALGVVFDSLCLKCPRFPVFTALIIALIMYSLTIRYFSGNRVKQRKIAHRWRRDFAIIGDFTQCLY